MSRTETPVDKSVLQDRARQQSAGFALILLIPTVLVCGLLYIASDYGGRCITYGEGCSQGKRGCLPSHVLISAVLWVA
ncbi:hypothetical protein FHS39_002382 [Streptomyces olivoverticillatus]|uniref:Uncharacterized protein n=1 Tax=Streptomyces olivoverticillatus TaxID=66427 RepID=A0A7W7LPI2_9ACTN|nr:hypothetical protein [Streptomyces olivoverticillatus]